MPVIRLVASPPGATVAIAVTKEAQFAVEVTSLVEPSLYFAVAVNCCVCPAVTVVVVAVTAIEDRVTTGGGGGGATLPPPPPQALSTSGRARPTVTRNRRTTGPGSP